MERKVIMLVEVDPSDVVDVKLGILCKCCSQHCVLSLVVLAEAQHGRKQPEQVARSLDIGTERLVAVIVAQSESSLHNEQVLVVVTQNGISACGIIKVIVLECV